MELVADSGVFTKVPDSEPDDSLDSLVGSDNCSSKPQCILPGPEKRLSSL